MNKKVWCTCEVVVLLIKPIVFLTFSLPSASLDLKVPNASCLHPCPCRKSDVTRDNLLLAKHGVTTLFRHRFERLQHCSNIWILCCAKNRRCESSRVTSHSSAREWTILFTGCEISQRHFGGKIRSTGSFYYARFSESVVVAETNYRMLEGLSFCDRERA